MSSNQFIKAKELGLPKPEVSEKTRKKISDALKGKKLSDSHKQKISETQKKNFTNGKSRWAFDRSKKSYAEEYFEKWLSSFSTFKMNLHVDRFLLDFAWPDKWIYIEVDGEQHFESQQSIDHDLEREKILEDNGWKCITRIRWSWFKSLSDTEKTVYLDSLKNMILGESTKLISFVSEKEKKELEYTQKLEEAKKLGTLTKNGRLHNFMKPTQIWEERKSLILESGVNINKYGWKSEVQKATGLSRRIIDETINHFKDDFENIIFKRKSRNCNSSVRVSDS